MVDNDTILLVNSSYNIEEIKNQGEELPDEELPDEELPDEELPDEELPDEELQDENENISVQKTNTDLSKNVEMLNKCCICGTIRNVGNYLDKIFENMELIGSLFDDYVIILYYDNSSDNTLQKIKEYKRKNQRLSFFINKFPMSTQRTFNLAKGRNFLIDTIKKNYSNYKYFIMMDCDDVCARDMNLRLLKEYLYRTDWDSLSFNHPTGYYDCWAFSKNPYVISCHHFKDGGTKYVNYLSRIINNTKRHELIPCLSAFNGFAIYRTHMYLNCRYQGKINLNYLPKSVVARNIRLCGKIIYPLGLGIQDCEHRKFHIQAFNKNKARNRISPLCLFK
jgi:hypothetical protein